MDILILQIGNGLIIGSVYALVALGLNMIWSITDIPDFAQGSFYVLAAYVGYFVVTLAKMPYFVALLTGMLLGATLAFLCERLLYRRWRERTFRGADRVQLLCGIALFFLFANVANALWTAKPRIFPSYMSGSIFCFSYMRINVLLAAVILFILVWLFIMKTRPGKAVRAASMDPGMAQVLGINLDMVNSTVFIIGGALFRGFGHLDFPFVFGLPFHGRPASAQGPGGGHSGRFRQRVRGAALRPGSGGPGDDRGGLHLFRVPAWIRLFYPDPHSPD